MNGFVVYDPATGAIKRSGHCSNPGDVALQAQPGEAVLALDRDTAPGSVARVDVSQSPPVAVPKA